MKTYQLKCVAPDGDTVTEGRDFPSIEAAWYRAEDMGSRWFFYPVSVVTGPSRDPVIVDAPSALRPFIGRKLKTLCAWFAANSEMVCDWLNNKAPFLSPYPYEK